jgi:recombination protein RecT
MMTTELTKQNKPLHVQLGALLDRMKPQLAMALPKHLTADRMARLTITAFNTNKELQKCSLESIIACVMTASQLGLEIGVLGQCYMIPYGTTATFVPGWKGLIDINARSGRSTVWTGAVFEGDEFEWELGDSPRVKHRPCGESSEGKLTHAYAIGRLNGSDYPVIECWNQQRLQAHRDRHNKVGAKHYSYKYWEMYARKVVLLQVLKYMPTSIEMAAAIEVSHVNEHGRNATIDANFVVLDSDIPLAQPGKNEPIGTVTDDSYAKAAAAREERLAQEAKTQAEAEAKYPVEVI